MTNFPQENIQPNEAGIIDTIVKATIAGQKSTYQPGTTARRDVHTKSHGTVSGRLTILPGIPFDYRVGLFADRDSHPVDIRLSNGAPGTGPDILPNVRGFAFKVHWVEGPKLLEGDEGATCVDFLMANHPSTFNTVIEDYPGIRDLMSVGNIGAMLKQFPSEGRMLLRAVLKFVKNPLTLSYFSQTPYALGDGACKYALVPQLSFWDRLRSFFSFPNIFDHDYLRHAVEKTLRKHSVKFTLCVQPQTAADPIEDSSVRWQGPLVPVAELEIFTIGAAPLLESSGEPLSFNPWRTLAAHRPMGWANRVRRAVYAADFKWRTAVNAAAGATKG